MEVIPSIEEMVDSMDETEMNKRYNQQSVSSCMAYSKG